MTEEVKEVKEEEKNDKPREEVEFQKISTQIKGKSMKEIFDLALEQCKDPLQKQVMDYLIWQAQ